MNEDDENFTLVENKRKRTKAIAPSETSESDNEGLEKQVSWTKAKLQ